jgi:hypothetical protein
MSEPQSFIFDFAEVAEALVRKQGIHEGLWGVYIEFGISAGNFGSSREDLRPTVLLPIQKIGIQRFPEANNLTVDAAVVNPPAAAPSRKKPPKRRS